ncbi:ATP-grasp domain-containing protein [Micromonosporaceae bacterium Da 78-11]
MLTADLPTVLVPVGYGAASPTEVVRAAAGLARIVFAADEAADRSFLDLLRDTATVLTAGDLDGYVRRARAAGVDGIVTFSDDRLELTADLAERLGLPHHTPAQVAAATWKPLQRLRLAEAGVEQLRYRVVHGPDDVDSAIAHVGLPAVAKPARGMGSRFTTAIRSAADLVRAVHEAAGPAAAGVPLLLEEMLPGRPDLTAAGWGDYVSVEAVVTGGRPVNLMVTGKFPLAEPFREVGSLVPARLDRWTTNRVLALNGAAIRAVGLSCGLVHTEMKLTPDGPRIIELNPRLGGLHESLVAGATGVSLVATALRAALNLPLPQGPLATTGVTWFHLTVPDLDDRTVLAVDGAADVRALPDVRQVRIVARPGTRVDPAQGTTQMLALTHGRSADHDAALRTKREIERRLTVRCSREAA